MVDYLLSQVDGGLLAGLSATLTWWFFISTIVMAILCCRQKYRFLHWFSIAPRERADACLNLAWLCFFAHATYQRAWSTYAFAYQEWKMSKTVLWSAPIYLPIVLFGMALFLWWACFELHGVRRRWWWCLWMWTGLAMCATVTIIF